MDPVFLTSASEWRNIEKKPDFDTKYVLIYCLKDSKRLLDYARKKYPGFKVVLLSPNDLRFYYGCKRVYYPGPREFLGLIDCAEAVVTDSFHGTAFSIIFEKELRVFITRPNVSSRIESLLCLLGCKDVIVMNECNDNPVKIDYRERLEMMIDKSINFLDSSLHTN